MKEIFLYAYAWLSFGLTLYYFPHFHLRKFFWIWWNGDDIMEYQIFSRPAWVLDLLMAAHAAVMITISRLPFPYGVAFTIWWAAPPALTSIQGTRTLGFFLRVANRLLAMLAFPFFFAWVRLKAPDDIAHVFVLTWWAFHTGTTLVMIANGLVGKRKGISGPAILYFCTVQIVLFVLYSRTGQWFF